VFRYIKKNPGPSANLELRHSLPDKFLEILQFIFIDHLLRNLVEEVTQLDDYNLYVYWLDQQHMTIMIVIAA
jgi:hypothetical protein